MQRKRRMMRGLVALLGAWLWLSAWGVQAQPYTALRFFDSKGSMIFHFNDVQASLDDLMALSGRYGMEATARGVLGMGRMQMAQMLRLPSIPQDWNETFAALGLPARPSATVYFSDLYSAKGIPDMIAVLPLQNTDRVLALVKQVLPNYFAMQEYQTCQRICADARQAVQLYQSRYGRMPKDMGELFTSGMMRKRGACREMRAFVIQGDTVTCGDLDNPQVWMQKNLQAPPLTPYKEAYVMRMDKLGVAIHKAGYVVLASRPESLRAALDRFSTQAKHPKHDAFVQNQDAQTRFQMYLNYQEFTKDAMKQQQQQMKQLQGMPFMEYLDKFQEYSKKYIGVYGDAWLIGKVQGDRYSAGMKMEIKGGDQLPLIRAIKTLPLVSAMRVYSSIPKDVFALLSGNFVRVYVDFFDEMLKAMGPMPMNIPLAKWRGILGEEVAFTLSAQGQKMLQGALYLEIADGASFDEKMGRWWARGVQTLGANPRAKLSSFTTPSGVVYRAQVSGPSGFPLDIALMRVGRFAVLTVEPERGATLPMLRAILDTTENKAASVLQAAHFAQALKQSPANNGVGYLDIEKMAVLARRYAPRLQGMQAVLTAMFPMQYAWMWGRMRPINSNSDFDSYLQMKPAGAASPAPTDPKEEPSTAPSRGMEIPPSQPVAPPQR
ncbi:hypothetical protein L6R29_15210 [Myxococcota bacterium]|nr:hypothetical protein [Myxococcota bacterium]